MLSFKTLATREIKVMNVRMMATKNKINGIASRSTFDTRSFSVKLERIRGPAILPRISKITTEMGKPRET